MKAARTKTLRVGELDAARREQIGREVVGLFLMSFEFEHTEMFLRRVVFRTPDTTLTLIYDHADTIIGFNTFNFEHVECRGRRHAVVHASVYGHPEFRGGGRFAVRRLAVEALRQKLRHPCVPLCVVGEASTPAGYARAVRNFAIVHPRRGVEPPAWVTELVVEVMRVRGFTPLEGDPWRVQLGLPFAIRNLERMHRHASSTDNPGFAYFLERNPDYRDNHWLVIYIPLDLAQLGAMIRRSLRGT